MDFEHECLHTNNRNHLFKECLSFVTSVRISVCGAGRNRMFKAWDNKNLRLSNTVLYSLGRRGALLWPPALVIYTLK